MINSAITRASTATQVDKGEEFSKNILLKYGWSQGKGLGKNEDGIVNPIKPSMKFDTAGVGYDYGEDFSYHWWDHAFNAAAKRLVVDNLEGEVVIRQDTPRTTLSTRRIQTIHADQKEQYGNFIKSGILANDGSIIADSKDDRKANDDIGLDLSTRLTDKQLFKKCGKITAHKAARHGHKLSGKLQRLKEQEKKFKRKQKAVL